jgi:hypothetical protein
LPGHFSDVPAKGALEDHFIGTELIDPLAASTILAEFCEFPRAGVDTF